MEPFYNIDMKNITYKEVRNAIEKHGVDLTCVTHYNDRHQDGRYRIKIEKVVPLSILEKVVEELSRLNVSAVVTAGHTLAISQYLRGFGISSLKDDPKYNVSDIMRNTQVTVFHIFDPQRV
jgi:hypothetical protein